MAKMTKTLSNFIVAIFKIVVITIVGLFIFTFVMNRKRDILKQDQADAEFKKKGLLRTIGEWITGEPVSATNSTREEAISKAQKEVEELQQKIEERDRKALEETRKIVNLDDSDFAQVLEEKKREIENRETKTDEKFDRTDNDIRIFRFSKPLSKKGKKITDFAFFTKSSSGEERKERKEEAKKQAKEAGFKLGTDKAGRETTPIHTLISSPEKIVRFKQQIEASQRRRLGERKIESKKKLERDYAKLDGKRYFGGTVPKGYKIVLKYISLGNSATKFKQKTFYQWVG